MIGWLMMHLAGRRREPRPRGADAEQLTEARAEAAEARQSARESIDEARRRMIWLEDALTARPANDDQSQWEAQP